MPKPTLSSAATGIVGLDDVTGGGLERGRVFLLEGEPGTGKTTIALQYVLAGIAQGEKCLYITLSETADELKGSATSHDLSVDGLDIFELVPPENLLDEDQQQSLLYSSDLELGEATKRIFDVFERVQPTRVVVDSLSEIRLLAQSSLRYRRQILALKHYFARSGATVLMLDDLTTEANDKTVHSIAHGVVRLEELAPDYGPERRRLRVLKYRGRKFRGGYHDFAIAHGGVQVFPRLVSAEHKRAFDQELLRTDSAELNALLGGGVDRGSSVLLLGPAGSGKSLLTLTFIKTASERGERAAMFVFDEELPLLIERAKGIGIDLEPLLASERLVLEQVDAAELTPGEFSERVRRCVELHGARTIVIDSLNGYQAAMTGENALILHIHELLQYLNRQGATTFLTVAQHGLMGEMKSPVDLTYIADTVLLLRYFEALGRVRRAISVIKKRAGFHEDTIREYQIGKKGLTLGQPLSGFQGILRGVPRIVGEDELMKREDA
ncbi:circadian clock protein KaiC [Erythrobacter arachoides]|uniref:non-specific serine/threonine protein kinase n=1 Tax=Aurantiacibacter arachoides TaxID=1850444 RepID=A0A845A8L1_9SPHN|nr:circadian clock protein KaiC [Aurantiacibacter arachoides]